ncbi:MAG: ParA family protein [Aeriscardovia sp.]|nr:ParA family protein [Aeriscardovia sp.]MBQ1357247.1 ParA family protein [Aeriscardovia sp.]
MKDFDWRERIPSAGELRGGFESSDDILSRIIGDDPSIASDLLKDTRLARSVNSRKIKRGGSTRVVSVTNQKGGVGKTTTTVNVATSFAAEGIPVLVIDLDPQANTSGSLGVGRQGPGIYEVMTGQAPMAKAVAKSSLFPSLDVVPSSIDLSAIELEIAGAKGREAILKDRLSSYLKESGKRYEYVFIDCAPSLGLLVLNALTASGEVLIPVQVEYYALEGLSQLLKTIDLVRLNFNPDLKKVMMILNMVDRRTILSRKICQAVRDAYPSMVLSSSIPRLVRVAEAAAAGESLTSYDPYSPASVAYRQACMEIAER